MKPFGPVKSPLAVRCLSAASLSIPRHIGAVQLSSCRNRGNPSADWTYGSACLVTMRRDLRNISEVVKCRRGMAFISSSYVI